MNFYTALSITNAALNTPLGFIAVVGNALVLVSIARTPSLISPSNVLLLGLAFSDFCIGLIVQPFHVTLKFLQVTDAEKNIQVLTRIHMFCAGYLCLVSFGNVSLLSIDRFLALHLHLRYKELVTVKRAVLFLGLLWVWSAVSISSSEMLQKDTAFIVGASVSCVAHYFNLILYYKIYRIVRRHQLQIISQAHVRPNTESVNITRFKRSFISAFYVYLLFIACYLPYTIMSVFESKLLHLSVFEISWTFVYVNSCLNPFLYSWRIEGVRTAIKSTIQKTKQLLMSLK